MINNSLIHKRFVRFLNEQLIVLNREIARLENTNLAYPVSLDSNEYILKKLFNVSSIDIQVSNIKLQTITTILYKIEKIKMDYSVASRHNIKITDYVQFLNILKVYLNQLKVTIISKQKVKLLKAKAKRYRYLSNLRKSDLKYILDRINIEYSAILLKGEILHIGGSIGKLQIVNKNISFKSPKIDWHNSLKLKKELIDAGKKPYSKKEAEEAERNNKPYDGVYWFMYKEGGIIPYITWHSPSHTIPRLTFSPNTANNTGLLNDEICKSYTISDIINSDKLGVSKKLRLLTQKQESYINNFQDYDL